MRSVRLRDHILNSVNPNSQEEDLTMYTTRVYFVVRELGRPI